MKDDTLDTLQQLTADLEKFVASFKEQHPELLRQRRAFRNTEFYKPAAELAGKMKETLLKCKQELLEQAKAFQAEHEAKLEKLKAELARRDKAAHTPHFRASNQGLDDAVIQELIHIVLALPELPLESKPNDSGDIWEDLDRL